MAIGIAIALVLLGIATILAAFNHTNIFNVIGLIVSGK